MAFKDLTKHLYPNEAGVPTVKLVYYDKPHQYWVRHRVDFDLPNDDPKAWGPAKRPKGVTTLIGDTLEKNGLMTWPMGMALQELFGFYNFEGENGEKLKGYMKERILSEDGKLVDSGKLFGTMWTHFEDGSISTTALTPDDALPMLISAQQNHNRKKKKGADIGSVVHDAIDHFINDNPFDIGEQYMWAIKDYEYEFEADQVRDLEDFEEDVKLANQAFGSFVDWWNATTPILYGSEDLLYSKKYNYSGTYDGDIGIKAEHHPVFHQLGQEVIRVTADWKTSKASKSTMAGMPQGIGYTYFLQDALYEIQRREMGLPPADDLLVVSCRKDGGFTLIYASELGLTVGDCIAWAEAVILCHQLMMKTKDGLWEHYYADTPDARPVKKSAKKKKV